MPSIPPAIINIAKFLVLLGVLIFVHELGHFLLARRFGVYVKKFFLGFDIGGLKIFSFKGKETEYGIGILPLGGYVKMAGQEDLPAADEEARRKLEEEERDIPEHRRFNRQPLRRRAAIVAAGPVMNLLLGVGLFILIARLGFQTPAYLSDPRVGWAEKGMPADRAGVLPGDLVREIDGRPVGDWEDLRRKLRRSRPGEELPLLLEREGEIREVKVVPERLEGMSHPQIGVAPAGEVVVRGIVPDSPAARAGLKAGDRILELDGRDLLTPIVGEFLEDFEGDRVAAGVFRPEAGERLTVSLPIERPSHIPGVYLDRGRVVLVDFRAGGLVDKLKKGDRVVGVGGRPAEPEEMAGRVRSAPPEEALELDIFRPGWLVFRPASRFTVTVSLSPRATVPDVYLDYDDETVLTRYPFPAAVPAGLRLGLEKVVEILEVFYLLITGRLGGAAIGGPVMIFQVTSVVRGVSDFLILLALISINLGLINLVPFPVLDGGHLLFFGLEGIIRRPLPERFLLVAQQIGLAVIAALILLITYQDILRALGF